MTLPRYTLAVGEGFTPPGDFACKITSHLCDNDIFYPKIPIICKQMIGREGQGPPLQETMIQSARVVSERFCHKLKFGNRRHTVCISRFLYRKVEKRSTVHRRRFNQRSGIYCPAGLKARKKAAGYNVTWQ